VDYKHSFKLGRFFTYIIISKLQAVKCFESVRFDHMAVYSARSIVTELWVGQPGNHGLSSFSGKRFFFLFSKVSILALGSTQLIL